MKSCDWEVLSTIVTDLSYSQISYMCGIRNCLREFEYSNETIYVPDSRGNINLLNLLERIGVEFHPLNPDEIISLKDFKNIILLVPLTMIKNITKIEEEHGQISLVYSAFKIEKIEESNIEIYIDTPLSQEKYSITIEQLKKLTRISSKPLGKSCYLVNIDNSETYSISVLQMNNILKESLKNFNTDGEEMYEGTKCIYGKKFYSKFRDMINGKEFWHCSKKAYLKRFLFISTLNAGAECFYRKDFLDSIVEYNLIEKGSNLYLDFHRLSNLWRKLNGILRKLQIINAEELEKKYSFQIIELIDSIQELEIIAVEKLKDKILEGESYNVT